MNRYEKTVDDEFQKFWQLVHDHNARRKRKAQEPEAVVRSTTEKIRKLLDALPPVDRAAVLSNVAGER